jgi:hypothetical protein
VSLVGGLFKSLVNPMSLLQLAMGPAGWASLAMKTIGSQIAMNVIQQLGQKMGLPQPMIDIAQASFAMRTGQPGLARENIREAVQSLGDQVNMSPFDRGQLERNAEFNINDFISKMDRAVEDGKAAAKRGNPKRGGSILEVLAAIMGDVMNAKVDQMKGLAQQMDNVKHKQGKTDSVQINTDLQVATQEFSMIMNSTANMIKTIGDGLTTMARKG